MGAYTQVPNRIMGSDGGLVTKITVHDAREGLMSVYSCGVCQWDIGLVFVFFCVFLWWDRSFIKFVDFKGYISTLFPSTVCFFVSLLFCIACMFFMFYILYGFVLVYWHKARMIALISTFESMSKGLIF